MIKCWECNKKKKEEEIKIGYCKKCEKESRVPMKTWLWVWIFALLSIITFYLYEGSVISMLIGICLGALLNLKYNGERNGK